MKGRCVAVTGAGIASALGMGREAFGAALFAGRCAFQEVVRFDVEGTGRSLAAEIADFDAASWLRSPKNYLDRHAALAFAACEMAVRESRLALPQPDLRPGVSLGAAAGSLDSLALFGEKLREKGPRLAPPFLFPHTYDNTTASLLAMEYGLGGPHGCFASGGTAGHEAVVWAAECVARGRTEVMIAGGAEALCEPLYRALSARGLLSPLDGGVEACRPFAPDRNGTLAGEGAACIVLENEDSARARNAAALARIQGMASDTNAMAAMISALEDAGVEPDGVDVVLAAAGGYREEDEEEAQAIRRLFGSTRCAVLPLKSQVGETLGASGPMALVAALAILESQRLPPSQCRERMGLPTVTADPRELRTAVVNALTPRGGRWVSLVLARQP